MSSFKKLSKSDVIVVPYVANKEWSFPSASVTQENGLVVYEGIKLTSSFDLATEPTTSFGEYQRLVFDSVNQLFYQSYYGETISTQSLVTSLNYISASGIRPTSSYFIYNENPDFISNLPTGSGDTIQVLSINQTIFGSKIMPNTFHIVASNPSFSYDIRDDGKGNIYMQDVHVGNIFYAHGLVVVTNPLYQEVFNNNGPTLEGEYNDDYWDDFNN